jgi:hypothetical protein
MNSIFKFGNYIQFSIIYYNIVMSSEIIQSVAYDNYDDFQLVNFIFSQNFISRFWELLMTKLMLG